MAFQERFDFDFIKVSPSNAFCATDWGSKTIYRGYENGTREYIEYAIKEAKGWQRLKPLDVTRGMLGEQLECLRLLHREIEGRVPFIQTIFNPLMVAKYLAGPEFIVHLRRYPREFKRALSVIGETMSDFAREAIRAGADGIFLAVQHASYDLLSEGEYRQFGIPYDLQLLESASDGWLNLLHIHGENITFDLLSGYPVQAVNWHTRTAPPTLKEAQSRFSGTLVGDLGRWNPLVWGSPEEVKAQVKEAIVQTEGRGLIVAAGCVVPITAPEINIRAAREAVEL